jgi:hypothetical protein
MVAVDEGVGAEGVHEQAAAHRQAVPRFPHFFPTRGASRSGTYRDANLASFLPPSERIS